jgi:hypothetical protein
MAYRIKQPKKRNVSYSEKEIKSLKNKNSYPEIFRTETRIALKVPEKTHQLGNIIVFKNQNYSIRKITDKGVYVSKVQEGKDGFIELDKKQEFITEKELQEGKAYPYYPLISWGLM